MVFSFNFRYYIYGFYWWDNETGLFWCNSRYYNPEWGRWISPDSIEYLDPHSINGLNLCAYCNNDPVNKYDTNGHMSKWAKTAIVGILTEIVLLALFAYVVRLVSFITQNNNERICVLENN